MTQIALPAEDITNVGNWVYKFEQTNNVGNIYQGVRDQTDEDFINSQHLPSSAVYVTQLDPLLDPEGASGETKVKFRMRKMATTAQQLDVTVELRQFYVDESDQGELIQSTTIQDVPDVLTDYEFIIDDTSFVVYDAGLFLRVIADTI